MLLRYLSVSRLCRAPGKPMPRHLRTDGVVSPCIPQDALGNGSWAGVAWHVPAPPRWVLPARWPLSAGCWAEQAVTAEHPARTGLLKGVPGPSGKQHPWVGQAVSQLLSSHHVAPCEPAGCLTGCLEAGLQPPLCPRAGSKGGFTWGGPWDRDRWEVPRRFYGFCRFPFIHHSFRAGRQ